MIIVRAVAALRRYVLYTADKAIRLAFLRDRELFYDRYFGSDHPIVLFIKNLLRPARFAKKLVYGQVISLPKPFVLSTPIQQNSDRFSWDQYAETLERDGIVFIPSVFAEAALRLKERYELTPRRFPGSDKYMRFGIGLNDPDVFRITTDCRMLGVFARYYGCQPYLRHLPGINCTHPNTSKARESIGFNNFWHYDTANLMTAHILLNDITEGDSCMFYAKGSHRVHRVQLTPNDYYYSEEYIHRNYVVVPCVGSAGTLVIFDPNGLHRVDLKPQTFRAHLHLNYVPGNDILKMRAEVGFEFPSLTQNDVDALSPLQKESLQHLKPWMEAAR